MSIVLHRGIIVPALFGLLFVLISAAYGALFFVLPIPLPVKVLIALGIGGIAAAMLYVLIQRNREIQEEEKDDLSKY